MNEWILALTIIILAGEGLFIFFRTTCQIKCDSWGTDKFISFLAGGVYYFLCWNVPRLECSMVIYENPWPLAASFKYVGFVHIGILGIIGFIILNKYLSDFIHNKRIGNQFDRMKNKITRNKK